MKIEEIIKDSTVEYASKLMNFSYLNLNHANFIKKYPIDNFEYHSLIVFQEDLPYYPKYKKLYRIEKNRIVSRLDEAVNRELMERNNQLMNEWEANLEKRNISRQQDNYYKEMDLLVEKTRSKIKKEKFKTILNETVYYDLMDKDIINEEMTDSKINKAIKEFLSKKENLEKYTKKILAYRYETRYIRVFNNEIKNQKLLEIIGDGFFHWKQFYFFIDKKNKTVYYFAGNSRNSGSRENHGFGAHLFSIVQNTKKIETDVVFISKTGQMESYTDSNFVCINKDIKGNYNIEDNESKKIMEKTKCIETTMDLDFDYFLATGKRLTWDAHQKLKL